MEEMKYPPVEEKIIIPETYRQKEDRIVKNGITTLEFVKRYLNYNCMIAIKNEITDKINYLGIAADIPYRYLRFTNFVSCEGLGEQGELVITVYPNSSAFGID